MKCMRYIIPGLYTYYIKAYTSHEGPNLANKNKWMLGVFDRKLGGSHSLLYCYFDKRMDLLSIRIVMHNLENVN